MVILSTLHRNAAKQPEGKKKPESILFYNANKCGVDMLDSMCRQMSTKAACRRWPLAVFCNILDLAGVNAWIIYRKKTGSSISRRQFLHVLSEQLRESAIHQREVAQPHPIIDAVSGKLKKRTKCQIKKKCKRNLTSSVCIKCKKPTCGMCTTYVCLNCQ